jgi:glycosyltransferase involved in cell wall biosynthesis
MLVPPEDTNRLAREIERVLEDAELRLEMRAAGCIQASRFSWRSMTDRTVASYGEAARA